jgi:hypothetical protein
MFQREVEEEEEEVEDFSKVVLAVGRKRGRTQECTADDDDDEAKEEAVKETMLAIAMEQLPLDATAIVKSIWWPRYGRCISGRF